jgi:hypothetical protein
LRGNGGATYQVNVKLMAAVTSGASIAAWSGTGPGSAQSYTQEPCPGANLTKEHWDDELGRLGSTSSLGRLKLDSRPGSTMS